MIKRGLIIIFLLLFVSFVNAQCDEETGGIEIGEECFNCGEYDKICPEDYGAECKIVDPDCNKVSSFFADLFRRLFSFFK